MHLCLAYALYMPCMSYVCACHSTQQHISAWQSTAAAQEQSRPEAARQPTQNLERWCISHLQLRAAGVTLRRWCHACLTACTAAPLAPQLEATAVPQTQQAQQTTRKPSPATPHPAPSAPLRACGCRLDFASLVNVIPGYIMMLSSGRSRLWHYLGPRAGRLPTCVGAHERPTRPSTNPRMTSIGGQIRSGLWRSAVAPAATSAAGNNRFALPPAAVTDPSPC
jgi:hypothetical protein